MKICHITSVHNRYDTRIYLKMLSSLINVYDDISIICCDNKGSEKWNGINIIDIGHSGGRLKRITKTTKRVLQKAIEVNADIYHFHDPELIPVGLKLMKRKKQVIYDIHEDVPKDILSKYYINKFVRKLISRTFKIYEDHSSRKFSYLITATPKIKERFEKLNTNTEVVNNYPIRKELSNDNYWQDKKDEICYIGAITEVRGLGYLIDSLEHTPYKLNLAGDFASDELKQEYQAKKGWENVNFYGFVNREEAKNILTKSKAGLVTFLPEPNHVDAQPNKLFEYMSAGVPVICSHFPLWKDIIEKNNCGICVDPENPKQIAEAINKVVENKDSEQMGENGVKKIEQIYNWDIEKIKLVNIYELLKQKI